MSKPLFKVSQKEIDYILSEVYQFADLLREQAIDQESIEEYICGICFNVAKNMVECSQCNKLNCESCIKEWLKGKNAS